MRQTTLQSEIPMPKKKMFNKENIPETNRTGKRHYVQPVQQNKSYFEDQTRKTMHLFPDKKNVTNHDKVIERRPSIRVFQQNTTSNFKLCDKSSQITSKSFNPLRSTSANIYSIFNNERIRK